MSSCLVRGFFTAALAIIATVALANPTGIWDFDLRVAGTYKVQVEHAISASPGTKVSYRISIGDETRTREFELIANRPFIPLVIDVPSAKKVRVAVIGLPDQALAQSRVYVYNADYLPYWQYFDPVKGDALREIEPVRALLSQPEEKIELGQFKLTIDKLVDPAINVDAVSKQLDAMVRQIMAMPEFGATPTSKAIALQRFIYAAGPWNGSRPFEYDLDDPLGEIPTNKLLSTYISTRKGNCVTMPLLFIILGQRVGIDITASSVPNHILVKFRNEAGTWINLEATSGANPARDRWIRQQTPSITDQSLESGIYLRPLTRRETAALMASLLSEHYFKQQRYQQVIALADLLLEHYPKDVLMMVRKGTAYGRIVTQYSAQRTSPSATIPPPPSWYYEHLLKNNHLWFANAEALGWRQETKEERQRYLDTINTMKATRSTN